MEDEYEPDPEEPGLEELFGGPALQFNITNDRYMDYFFPQRRPYRARRNLINAPGGNMFEFNLQMEAGMMGVGGQEFTREQLRLILMRELVARELIRRMRLNLDTLN